jgi:hypothetical protein
MTTPSQEQADYDYVLAARLLLEAAELELAIENELDNREDPWREEVSVQERIYALRSDNRRLQQAIVRWHNSMHADEMSIDELGALSDTDLAYWA